MLDRKGTRNDRGTVNTVSTALADMTLQQLRARESHNLACPALEVASKIAE